MLFNFQVFGDCPIIFLVFISSLIPLCSENTLYYFSGFKFVKLFLWPRIRSLLVYVAWALEKYVYCAVVGQSAA